MHAGTVKNRVGINCRMRGRVKLLWSLGLNYGNVLDCSVQQGKDLQNQAETTEFN